MFTSEFQTSKLLEIENKINLTLVNNSWVIYNMIYSIRLRGRIFDKAYVFC